MATTLINLRSYMRDWLYTSSTRIPDSSCNQIINIAMRQIARTVDLRYNEYSNSSVAISNGTATVAVPSIVGTATFSRAKDFFYTNLTNSAKINLINEIDYAVYRDKYANGTGTGGEPIEFAILGQNLYLGPTPNRNITATMDFYGIPVDLSADGDHNDLTDGGWEAVLFTALAYASRYMLEDERGAAAFDGMARKAINDLQVEHERSRWAGSSFPQLVEPQ